MSEEEVEVPPISGSPVERVQRTFEILGRAIQDVALAGIDAIPLYVVLRGLTVAYAEAIRQVLGSQWIEPLDQLAYDEIFPKVREKILPVKAGDRFVRK